MRIWNGYQWRDVHTHDVELPEVERLSGATLKRAEEGDYDPVQDVVDGAMFAAAEAEQPVPNMVDFSYADEDLSNGEAE